MSLPPPPLADASSPRPTIAEYVSAWRAKPRPLLPEWLSRRSLLLWTGTLPQIILLLINLRAWSLIAGEVNPDQRFAGFAMAGLELALLAGVTALALLPWRSGRLLTWRSSLPLLAVSIGYLWAVLWKTEEIIPQNIAPWMLPANGLIYYQFILVMPLVFHVGLWLACRPVREIGAREAAVVACLIFGAVFISGIAETFTHSDSTPYVAVCIGFFLLCGALLLLAGFTRGCVSGYAALRRGSLVFQTVMWALIGLAAPIGGLCLNAVVPFPNDFQAWPVYALTVLNGGALLLPHFRPWGQHRVVWLVQCALFPFSLYFFLVFLPFLPLTPLAILIMGAGFLMLAPTALFLLHGQRLLEGFQHEAEHSGRRRAALYAIAAMALLPALYVGQTLRDRVVLRGALDYVYSPDYRHTNRFSGSPAAVRRSLEHLRDFKAGLQLPFLSEFYNWAVFDNLVLPDEKMNVIHQAFFGTDLAPARDDALSNGGGSRRGRTLRELAANQILPATDVKLDQVTATTVRDGACERTTFQLQLQGRSSGPNEFTANIEIPEGVFVSGFWLKIGSDRVAGKLFEKKAALWVYEKIRNITRPQDPGILYYRDAHTMNLRVFPITGTERRHVELEILYPAGMHPSLKIGSEQWQGAGTEPVSALSLTAEGTSALTLTPEAIAQLPRAERMPYLHFIVDRSAGAVLPEDQIPGSMRAISAKFPEAREAMLTWANYEYADALAEPAPIEQVCATPLTKAPAKRGGFLGERAVKRSLLSYHDRLAHAAPDSPWLKRYPIIVLLGSKAGSTVFTEELASFRTLAPDSPFLYATPDGVTYEAIKFPGARGEMSAPAPRPVALLKVGNAVVPCALDTGTSAVVVFEPSTADRSLSALEGGAFRPLAATSTLPPETPYARAISAAQQSLGMSFDPSLGNRGLTALVNFSRETGILLPATTYIVVENTAQWEMLKRKEKQKLGNQTALEFEETPEPTSGLLLLAGGVALLSRRRTRAA